MSLPSRMVVYGTAGNVLKNWFVNCGWTLTADSLYLCLKDLNSYEPEAIKWLATQEYAYVELYEWKFPKDIIRKILCSKKKDAIQVIETFIDVKI